LKGFLAVTLAVSAALVGLLQTSCSKSGEDHLFLKVYTSSNMVGTIEPCG
jgi:hypothetical protein